MVDRHWEGAAAGSPSNVYKNTNLILKYIIKSYSWEGTKKKYKE
jgi:hypothetical protein